MPAPTREQLRKAEKEIGANIPEEMKGLDTEDLGEPTLRDDTKTGEASDVEKEDDEQATSGA